MFVRQKQNKRGVVSIQVIDKSSGRYKVVKTIGSSSDTHVIDKLAGEGESWIKKQKGLEIDFGKIDELYIISNYAHLWRIEKAFRVAKTDIKIRPIYHQLPHWIGAHICIAFVSYKIYKELERQLKNLSTELSPEKAIEITKTIYCITAQKPKSNEIFNRVILLNEEQEYLAKLFNF